MLLGMRVTFHCNVGSGVSKLLPFTQSAFMLFQAQQGADLWWGGCENSNHIEGDRLKGAHPFSMKQKAAEYACSHTLTTSESNSANLCLAGHKFEMED